LQENDTFERPQRGDGVAYLVEDALRLAQVGGDVAHPGERGLDRFRESAAYHR